MVLRSRPTGLAWLVLCAITGCGPVSEPVPAPVPGPSCQSADRPDCPCASSGGTASRSTFPARPNDQVDLLLVIDGSAGMEGHQAGFQRALPSLLAGLRQPDGRPLDYRIAIVSTDPEAGFQIHPRTDPRDWEASAAGRQACGDPATGLLAADPALCQRLQASRLALVEPCQGLALTVDKPFVDNSSTLGRYDDEVARQLGCLVSLGVGGSPITQPLEAARAAWGSQPDVAFRETATRAVIFLTRGTDCSLADRGLLEKGPGFRAADPTLRCYVDAQQCDGSIFSAGGLEYTASTRCQDAPRWLVPLEDYLRFLDAPDERDGLAARSRPLVLALTGAPDYRAAPELPAGLELDPADLVLLSRHSASGDVDAVLPSCRSEAGEARPNRRLLELVAADPDGAGRSFSASLCDDDLGPSLAELGQRIQARLAELNEALFCGP